MKQAVSGGAGVLSGAVFEDLAVIEPKLHTIFNTYIEYVSSRRSVEQASFQELSEAGVGALRLC